MKEGDSYLTGTIQGALGDEKRIMVFKNDKKNQEKQPDYYLLVQAADLKGETKLKRIGSLWKRIKKESKKEDGF